jgi:hypothetical protein
MFRQIFMMINLVFGHYLFLLYFIFTFLKCHTFLIDQTFLKVEIYNTLRRKMAKYLIYIQIEGYIP